MNIVNDIYKEILSNYSEDIDITKEDLANIVLHEILKKPYFNECYSFLDLSLLGSKKIVLHHPSLNDYPIVTNNNLSAKTFSFNTNGELDVLENNYNVSRMYNDFDLESISTLKKFLEESDNIYDLLEKNKNHIKDNELFLFSLKHSLNELYSYEYRDSNILNLLTVFSNIDDYIDSKSLEIPNNYYSTIFSSNISDISLRDLFYLNCEKHLNLTKEELFKKSIDVDNFELSRFKLLFNSYKNMNNNIFSETVFNNFEDTKDNRIKLINKVSRNKKMYENTIFKVVNENENIEDRKLSLINNALFKHSKRQTLTIINNIERNNSFFNDMLLKNDYIISEIVSKIENLYPFINEKINSNSIKINTHNHIKSSNIVSSDFLYDLAGKENIFKIFNYDDNCHMASKGFYDFVNDYDNSCLYFIGRNDYETLAMASMISGKLENSEYEQINKSFNVLTLYNINISKHLRNDNETLDNIIKKIIKYCEDNEFHIRLNLPVIKEDFYMDRIKERINTLSKDSKIIIFKDSYQLRKSDNKDKYKQKIKKEIYNAFSENIKSMNFEDFYNFNNQIENAYEKLVDLDVLNNSEDSSIKQRKDYIKNLLVSIISEINTETKKIKKGL